MKISIQTDRFEMLEEITKSGCDKVRFGSDFCEWKIPSPELLREAYRLTRKIGVEFSYVTPRLSSKSLEIVREELAFLDSNGDVDVVINDLGLFNILGSYPNLRPHLGRRLVFMSARCPWLQDALRFRVGFFERKKLEEIYYQTSLNYLPTIRFYQKYGIKGADVDWIPRCFPYLDFLMKNGLSVSVHLQLAPVTVTRRCHTARFLGEKDPWLCSKPCNAKAFLLRQPTLKLELYLYGNAIFRLIQPSLEDAKKLRKQGVEEFIVAVNPVTKMESRQEMEAFIQSLTS